MKNWDVSCAKCHHKHQKNLSGRHPADYWEILHAILGIFLTGPQGMTDAIGIDLTIRTISGHNTMSDRMISHALPKELAEKLYERDHVDIRELFI